jgi:hypothetical protein
MASYKYVCIRSGGDFVKLWLLVVRLLIFCTLNISQKCFVMFYLKWHGALDMNMLNASHNWWWLLYKIILPVVIICMSCSTNIYVQCFPCEMQTARALNLQVTDDDYNAVWAMCAEMRMEEVIMTFTIQVHLTAYSPPLETSLLCFSSNINI